MKHEIFFKAYQKHGLSGYNIPVRNTFSNCVEMEFIPEEARVFYERQFGQEIISDEMFIDWYAENAHKFIHNRP